MDQDVVQVILREVAFVERPPCYPDPWKVKCWRVAAGLSQDDLAKKLGWSPSAKFVYRLEAGSRELSSSLIEKLATAIGVHPYELVSDELELAANRKLYGDWIADGRPPLQDWFEFMRG